MANQIKKVSISVMKASNGIFFYTTLVNDQGVHMELFDTEILAQAVHSADELAEFFGIEAERLKPLPYLTQETIDTAYIEGRKYTDFEHLNEIKEPQNEA